MKRNVWEFSYTADKLLAGVLEKVKYHTDRLKWWEDKKLEVIELIKKEGIDFNESLAVKLTASASYTNNSGYRQSTIEIRDDLAADFAETQNKIAEHKSKLNDYKAWVAVLESQGQTSYPLNQDDWLYFFGK